MKKKNNNDKNYDPPPPSNIEQNHGVMGTSRWPPMKML